MKTLWELFDDYDSGHMTADELSHALTGGKSMASPASGRILAIGKPTHFRVKGVGVETACGYSALNEDALDAAYDPRDVDCLRCRATRIYKKAVGE